MPRTLPFVPKPTPAKAILTVRRIATHLQVLHRLAPACVAYLEREAAELRRRAELADPRAMRSK